VFLASVPPGAAERRVRPVARADVPGRGLGAGRLRSLAWLPQERAYRSPVTALSQTRQKVIRR